MKKRGTKKTSPQRSQASAPPVRKRPRHWLMPNELYKFIDKYKAGKLPLDEQVTMKPHHVVRDVLPFIEADGDFGVLCDMVKTNPRRLTHAVVWGIIEHLQGVPWGGTSHPAVEREEAQIWLRQIVAAWVQGMLPGYSVKPPKRQGRKLGLFELQWREDLVTEYEDLLRLLKKHDVTWPEHEADEAALGRLEELLVSTYDEWQPPLPPGAQKKSTRNAKTFPDFHKPLDRGKMKSLLAKAPLELGTTRHLDYLAYILLGHHYDRTPDQVRGFIQHERRRQRTEYLP